MARADEVLAALDVCVDVLAALLSIIFDDALLVNICCELLPSGLFVVGGSVSPPAPPQPARNNESSMGSK